MLAGAACNMARRMQRGRRDDRRPASGDLFYPETPLRDLVKVGFGFRRTPWLLKTRSGSARASYAPAMLACGPPREREVLCVKTASILASLVQPAAVQVRGVCTLMAGVVQLLQHSFPKGVWNVLRSWGWIKCLQTDVCPPARPHDHLPATPSARARVRAEGMRACDMQALNYQGKEAEVVRSSALLTLGPCAYTHNPSIPLNPKNARI
jgi:hypothetical protein